MERMNIPRATLLAAFEHRHSRTLEEFLQDFSPMEQDEIRKAVTPGMAFLRSDDASVVTKVPLREEHDPPEGSNTWLTHKEWISNGPYQLPAKAVAQISSSTRDICAAINASQSDRNYGLVVGYVQSGKTANYTALLSRAADMGYTFVVVLSGILNDLREQTQKRLMRDLLGDPFKALDEEIECIDTSEMTQFTQVTSMESDFRSTTAEHLPRLIEKQAENGKPILAVMKKNVIILEHLLDGLKRCNPGTLSKQKLLIIDDEADHATVNTGGEGEQHADDEFADDEGEEEEFLKDSNPTRTNRRIRQIIKAFQKSTYVGYTATPFANVLINKDIDDPIYGKSLYPRDFIVALPDPDGYFGADRFFGGLDDPEDDSKHTVVVPPKEAKLAFEMQLDPDSTREANVPASLRVAMMDFILTGLVKDIRRKSGIKVNKHHTMLIHIQWRNDDQSKTTEAVSRLFEDWKELAEALVVGKGVRDFRDALRERWESEYESSETWSQILEELSVPEDEGGWMGTVQVRMINSLDSEEKLDYDKHPRGLSVIAIGGNKLSRGLTLEGLTTSYFLRKTKMYDSLLQMGRWFGYRPGYEDLVRVHSSLELLTWFQWLVEVESHIRQDIARYSFLGLTPEKLAVRVPIHSEMKVTASSKMKNAIRSIADYQGTHVQSIRLPLDDESRLMANLDATSRFLESLTGGTSYGSRMWAWRGVSASAVADFLEDLDIDGPPNAVFDALGIARYLRENHSSEEIFVAQPGSDVLKLKQGPGRVPSNDPGWDFGVRYVARSQGFMSLNGERVGTNNLKVISDRSDVKLSEQLHQSGVCLLVYLIAPGSKPRNDKRMSLPNHETPIVGVSIRFPSTEFEKRIKAYAHTRGVRAVHD